MPTCGLTAGRALEHAGRTTDLRFVDITDIRDGLLLPWLNLYETSFPPEEKMLVSEFLLLLKEKAEGEREHSHMTAALDSEGKLFGEEAVTVVGELRLDWQKNR